MTLPTSRHDRERNRFVLTEGGDVAVRVVMDDAATGNTSLFDNDADNTDQTIKSAAGSLWTVTIENSNSTKAYLQLFDNASPTVGTTTPTFVIPVPPNGIAYQDFEAGMGFATAIHYAFTTTATGNTDPTTGGVLSAIYT